MPSGHAWPSPTQAAAALLAGACALCCLASEPAGDAPPAAPAAAGPDDALVAPIALYPDTLLAIILPASTVPGEIVAASNYLIQYGDATRIDGQPWDPSVRALAHYPTVIAWMAENIAWTRALGRAFMASPSEVMSAVQRLRARALAAGVLAPTPQQQVSSQDGAVQIYPAQPDSVYVPAYDESVVFPDDAYVGFTGPLLGFDGPYPAGGWLSFYLDWGGHRLLAGGRDASREHGGWQPSRGGGHAPPGAHPWEPPGPGSIAAPRAEPPGAGQTPRPRPMRGAPSRPPTRVDRGYEGKAAQPLSAAPVRSATAPAAAGFSAPPAAVHSPPPAPVRVAEPPAVHSAPAPAQEPVGHERP